LPRFGNKKHFASAREHQPAQSILAKMRSPTLTVASVQTSRRDQNARQRPGLRLPSTALKLESARGLAHSKTLRAFRVPFETRLIQSSPALWSLMLKPDYARFLASTRPFLEPELPGFQPQNKETEI